MRKRPGKTAGDPNGRNAKANGRVPGLQICYATAWAVRTQNDPKIQSIRTSRDVEGIHTLTSAPLQSTNKQISLAHRAIEAVASKIAEGGYKYQTELRVINGGHDCRSKGDI